MSEGNTYHQYTAADIEKYHKGLLSPAEMHAIEKAALDDPFLADALDGYGNITAGSSTDLADLENRLENRIGGKVVTMNKRRGFLWLRIAAAIVVVSATALLIYRFGIGNNKEKPFAVQNTELEKKTISVDSITTGVGAFQRGTTTDSMDVPSSAAANTNNTVYRKETDRATAPVVKFDSSLIVFNSLPAYNNVSTYSTTDIKPADSTKQFNLTATVPPKGEDVMKDKEAVAVNTPTAKRNPLNAEERRPQDRAFLKSRADSAKANGYYAIADDVAKQQKKEKQQLNIFRGRVLDNNNNGVPFANVTNIRDNIGTYTDARGNFGLVSSDTVMNVVVHSNGFINNQALLKNNLDNNLVMQEDKSTANQTVLSNKAFNSNRSREANIKVEEPEPADGWPNYDTYLANNLKMPDDDRMKQPSGHVEVSFEVDKNGDPVNIRVEKSLCDQCDREAVRLVKEGPKWKRKGKKRVTINVSFNE